MIKQALQISQKTNFVHQLSALSMRHS